MIAPVVTTDRLILTGHHPDHLDPLAAMWADPAVYTMIGGVPRSREEVWLRLLRSIGQWQAFGYGSWVFCAPDGTVLGEGGLMEARRTMDPPLTLPEANWVLAPHAHGRGFAYAAMTAALGWAERNRATHAERVAAAGSTVTLDRLDCAELRRPATGPLGGLSGQVDVLVSNPPYIPDGSTPREPEVALHDPPLALYGGPDGLTVIGHLREGAGWLLRPRGWLVVEHADSQGAAGAPSVPGLLAADPRVTEVHDTDDLTGRPRVTSARFTGAGHR